jgi:tetratricopeptide (TPR) repeat protein
VPDFPPWVADALAVSGAAGSGAELDALVDARLVDVAGTDPAGQPRCRMHDLVRLFGRERTAEEDPPGAVPASLGRAFDTWVYLLQRAEERTGEAPGGPPVPACPAPVPWASPLAERLTAEPIRLLDAERHRLVPVVRQAADLGLNRTSWLLAASSLTYWERVCGWTEWRQTHEAALAAVRRTGDRQAEATMLSGLGALASDQRHQVAATGLFRRAAAIFQEIGDVAGEAGLLQQLAVTLRRSGQLDEAEQTCIRALELFTVLDKTTDRGLVWWNLGWVYLNRSAYDAATDGFRAALDLCGEDRRQQAFCWHGMTETERQRGDLTTATRYAERTLEIWTELGDRRGEVYTLRGIGRIHLDQGQPHRARPVLMRAMGTFEELGLVDGQAMVLTDLADASMLGDDPAGAAELLRRAVQLWQTIDSPQPLVDALVELARAYDALGEPALARAAADHALRVAETMQVPELVETLRARLSPQAAG